MRIQSKLIFFSLLLGVFFACKKDEEDNTPQIQHDTTPYILDYGNSFGPPPIPSDNQLTIQGVKLGRMLFHETMLSADGTMSCASCHRQNDGFSDTAQFSIGVQGLPGGRQAMAIHNMAWNTNGFFWDGRAPMLRDQSLLPIQDELEMNESLDNVVLKLSNSQSYKDQFSRAFGSDNINPLRISLAMEQFMNSIISVNSKYDQYLNGEVEFTESEQNGMDLFFAEYNPFFPDESGADCAHCHSNVNFENDQYMNNGLDSDEDMADFGRFDVTGDEADKGKFKVTSLRNIALTPPFMHDGRFNTLHEVVEHYNSGIVTSTTVDPAILNTQETGLMLSPDDIDDLVNFLHTLSDETFLTNSEYSNPF